MSGTILDEILAHKKTEVEIRKGQRSAAALESKISDLAPTRGFTKVLKDTVATSGTGIIAEVKKASPSKGVIRADFQPNSIAESYATAGAACLSVLTDERYFQGHDEYLSSIRQAVTLPLLRKEFIVDAYQLPESRSLGADCVLLIVAALSQGQLTEFFHLARDFSLDVLIEVHDQAELEAALKLNPAMIGINNRNLKTFETTLDNTFALLDLIPSEVLVVTESGIRTHADVTAMRDRGVNAFLVGEAFMREADPGAALRALFY
jgi:indole-3-glycerol phosphate synthase